jgi:hypothetical protein
LPIFDDIDNRKRHEIKEMADEIKKLLSLRIDRYTVVAHGVTKSHLANWWSNFGFPKEIVSGETFLISNFVSCQQCFATFQFFRQRLHSQLITMFIFDDRHYMAMCLHPALREMGKRSICFVLLT